VAEELEPDVPPRICRENCEIVRKGSGGLVESPELLGGLQEEKERVEMELTSLYYLSPYNISQFSRRGKEGSDLR